jgi:hypothetical protein
MEVENIFTAKKLPAIVITHQDSQSSESSETSNSDASIFAEPEAPALHYKVNDVPKWNAAIIFGLQVSKLLRGMGKILTYLAQTEYCINESNVLKCAILLKLTICCKKI